MISKCSTVQVKTTSAENIVYNGSKFLKCLVSVDINGLNIREETGFCRFCGELVCLVNPELLREIADSPANHRESFHSMDLFLNTAIMSEFETNGDDIFQFDESPTCFRPDVLSDEDGQEEAEPEMEMSLMSTSMPVSVPQFNFMHKPENKKFEPPHILAAKTYKEMPFGSRPNARKSSAI